MIRGRETVLGIADIVSGSSLGVIRGGERRAKRRK